MATVTFISVISVAMLVLFLLSVPIFASFLICNLIAVYLLIGPAGFGMFVNSAASTSTSLSLIAIPLFILMGEILSRASAVDRLMDAVDALVGAIRGRLYILTIAVSTILAAMSGSAMASAAMLGRGVIPKMVDRGYDKRLSFGVALGGACLAPIIPPSIFAILVGTLAQVSIGDLFTAGVLPGILIAVLMIGYVFGRIALKPSLAPPLEARPPLGFGGVLRAIGALLPFAGVIGIVMGGILGGLATPSEAAVLGVVGAIFVAAVYGRLSLDLIISSLKSAAMLTGMILIVLVSSQFFSQILSFSGASGMLRSFVAGLDFPPLVMLFIMLLIPYVMCMLLDEIAVMLILIPLYIPLLGPLGFEPIWFWTLFLINLTLGAITPPVGYVLYVLQATIPDTKLSLVFRAAVPFIVIFTFTMVIVALFPGIVTVLIDS